MPNKKIDSGERKDMLAASAFGVESGDLVLSLKALILVCVSLSEEVESLRKSHAVIISDIVRDCDGK